MFKLVSTWSRSHAGYRNYLLISEEYITVHTPTVGRNQAFNWNEKKPVEEYEVEMYLNKKPIHESNFLDHNHFIYESITAFHKSGSYKFFLVRFGNGIEIVCTSWEEFIEQVKALSNSLKEYLIIP